MGQPETTRDIRAARLHIFIDGFGWSENENADLNQLTFVRTVQELPCVHRDCFTTVFNCGGIEDLEQLRDMLNELIIKQEER